jgi:transcriptional regulator with XRE-family HTH domain
VHSLNAIEDVCKTRIHPIDIFVGSRVRLRREELQITQQKLGSLLGLTFQQIQKYESGMNRVSASRLFEISRILLVDIKYFFEEVTEEVLQVSVSSAAISKQDCHLSQKLEPEVSELIKTYASIRSASIRKSLLALISTIQNSDGDHQSTVI